MACIPGRTRVFLESLFDAYALWFNRCDRGKPDEWYLRLDAAIWLSWRGVVGRRTWIVLMQTPTG
jgi:hypothetical protein